MTKKIKVGIIGAGGVGLTCAAFLAKTSDVVLKTRRKEQATALNKKGITMVRGKTTSTIKGFTATAETKDLHDCDVIIVTVKSYDTRTVAQELNIVLEDHTEVVTIQNGLDSFDVLRDAITKPQRVFAGLTYVGANRTDDTSVLLGTLTTTVVDVAAEKAGIALEASEYDFEASTDVKQAVWDKMVLNTGQNALGAITNLNLGEMGESEYCLSIAEKLLDEFEAVAAAEEITFDTPLMTSLKENWKGSHHHPSMWQDIQAGKRTEIDTINGAIVKLGTKHNINTPYNDMITSLIKAIEKDESLG